MTAYDIEPGDKVHPGDPVIVDRYSTAARINHWITAISLILLALSGLAMFHPSLFFLTGLFGGGQANLWVRSDSVWLSRLRDVLSANEERLPEVGKYNAGQKVVFWSMSLLIIILIATGFVIWDIYFGQYTTIEQKRVAVLIHSIAAVTIICVWIVHVYAAIWVKGTINAMTRGQVTGGWAWRHHRKWLRELVSGKGSG